MQNTSVPSQDSSKRSLPDIGLEIKKRLKSEIEECAEESDRLSTQIETLTHRIQEQKEELADLQERRKWTQSKTERGCFYFPSSLKDIAALPRDLLLVFAKEHVALGALEIA
jgi:predicted  nucleic acid-binding Zn-ribbon protein